MFDNVSLLLFLCSRKEMFSLTMHSTHFIYGYNAPLSRCSPTELHLTPFSIQAFEIKYYKILIL